jgi:methyl-accepting chemotaxis protein
MNTLLIVFIIVTSFAVVIQMAILFALYQSTRKTSAKVEALAEDVQKRAAPVLDAAHTLLVDNREKLDTIVDNVAVSSTTVRNQLQRLDTTVTDVVDRTRLQVIRADELVTRTMDRVEETSDLVHHTVISPVRQLAAVVRGATVFMDTFFGRRSKPPERVREPVRRTASDEEELFI